MDKTELKLRELQHEEVETFRKLQRLVLTKVSKTPFWAKIIIFMLCMSLVHTHFFTDGKEDYKSEEVAASHRQTKRAFMKAVAYFKAGDIEAMNIALDEMAKTNLARTSNLVLSIPRGVLHHLRPQSLFGGLHASRN